MCIRDRTKRSPLTRCFPIALVVMSALLLQGCIAAAVVGSAAVATKTATDPRSVGTVSYTHLDVYKRQ